MKNNSHSNSRAFTLIEMLVVISIIGVLAALLFPVGSQIKRNAILRRARAELTQLETGIESYKLKLGFYPPDNPLPDSKNPSGDPKQGTPVLTPLYFEILGVIENGNYYETLDGSGRILKTDVQTIFGRDGFLNFGTRKAEEGTVAQSFFPGTLKPDQYGELSSGIKVLIAPTAWPDNLPALTSKAGLNPVRYVSSHPTNNTKSYDLWIDMVIQGKTNRVSNWRKDVEFVYWP